MVLALSWPNNTVLLVTGHLAAKHSKQVAAMCCTVDYYQALQQARAISYRNKIRVMTWYLSAQICLLSCCDMVGHVKTLHPAVSLPLSRLLSHALHRAVLPNAFKTRQDKSSAKRRRRNNKSSHHLKVPQSESPFSQPRCQLALAPSLRKNKKDFDI